MHHSGRRAAPGERTRPEKTDSLAPALQQRLERARMAAQQRAAIETLQLPLWPAIKRGTPNTFLRSALFCAIQSKDRQFLKEEVLASQEGISVKFTGQQLNQEDLSLWETLVHMARDLPLGELLTCSAHSILMAQGLPTGGEQHKQLHSAIIRLQACSVEVTYEGKTYFGGLVKSGKKAAGKKVKGKPTSHYAIELNRELIKLYGENQWTALDWDQRRRLARKPLAQALHGYYSSHRNPFPVSFAFLQKITGSRNRQASGFKRRCSEALQDLKEVGFLLSYNVVRDEKADSVEKEKVVVQRAPPLALAAEG